MLAVCLVSCYINPIIYVVFCTSLNKGGNTGTTRLSLLWTSSIRLPDADCDGCFSTVLKVRWRNRLLQVLSEYPPSLWLFKVIPNDATSKICFIYLVLVNLWLTEDSNALPSSCFAFWNPVSSGLIWDVMSSGLIWDASMLTVLESHDTWFLSSLHWQLFSQTLVSPRSLKRGMHFTLLWRLSPKDWIRIWGSRTPCLFKQKLPSLSFLRQTTIVPHTENWHERKRETWKEVVC